MSDNINNTTFEINESSVLENCYCGEKLKFQKFYLAEENKPLAILAFTEYDIDGKIKKIWDYRKNEKISKEKIEELNKKIEKRRNVINQ